MKNLASIALFTLFVTNLLVGCIGGDNETPAAGDDQMDQDPGQDPVAPIAFPQTCAEAKVGIANIVDGEHILFIGGDEQKPWSAYCVGMDTKAPKEYLTLLNASGGSWSEYRAGGQSPGTDVRTYFDKIRIDPLTQKIDVNDQSFATSLGSLMHLGTTQITSMPVATAMACGPDYATASLDVGGTSFKLISTQFTFGGDVGASANASLWPGDQVVEQFADGNCAWSKPVNTDLMTPAGSFTLQLTYSK